MALLPGSAEEPAREAPAVVTAGTLGELMVRRTARDRRLLWKRLGLAASGTFTLAAAITVVTGASLRQPPAPTPGPVAAPGPQLGTAADGRAPVVAGPIVAPEAPPSVLPPPVSLADGRPGADHGVGVRPARDDRGGCPDDDGHGGSDHGGSGHDGSGHDGAGRHARSDGDDDTGWRWADPGAAWSAVGPSNGGRTGGGDDAAGHGRGGHGSGHGGGHGPGGGHGHGGGHGRGGH